MKFCAIKVVSINVLLYVNVCSSLLLPSFFISENFIAQTIKKRNSRQKNPSVPQEFKQQEDSTATFLSIVHLFQDEHPNSINPHDGAVAFALRNGISLYIKNLKMKKSSSINCFKLAC